MRRLKSILTIAIMVLGDILAIFGSFLFGYFIRAVFSPGGLSTLAPTGALLSKIYFLLIYPFVFAYEGLYTKRLTEWEERRRYFRGVLVGSAILTILLFMVRLWIVSRFVVIVGSVVGIIFMPLLRGFLKKVLVQAKFFYQPLVVLGDDKTVKTFVKGLNRHTILGYSVAHCVTRGADRESINTLLKKVDIFPGSLLVVLAECFNSEELRAIFTYAEQNFAEMMVVPDQRLLMSSTAEVEQMGDLLVLKYRYNLLRPLNNWTKRVLEVLLSLTILILLLPVFAIIALLVKVSSAGPVFFKQPRIGKGGKLFTCLKFRTMLNLTSPQFGEVSDSEFKVRNDPRITPVGRFLRRFSLDELPQLYNVLRGEMALVGPRPYLPEELNKIGDYVRTIVRVRPGMTGLWQVSGRAELSFQERILLDEYYIRNWSLWLDFTIVLRTVSAVLSGRGAY